MSSSEEAGGQEEHETSLPQDSTSSSSVRIVRNLEHGMVLFKMDSHAGNEFHNNKWAVEIDFEPPYFTVMLVNHKNSDSQPA